MSSKKESRNKKEKVVLSNTSRVCKLGLYDGRWWFLEGVLFPGGVELHN